MSISLALDRQRDPGVRRTPHAIDRIVQRQSEHGLAIECSDDVAGLDPGLKRRRVIDRRDDLDQALILGHFQTEAAELALGLDLHVLERFGVHVGAVRVQSGQHAIDGVFQDFLVADRIDVFRANPLEHVAENFKELGRLRVGLILLRDGTAQKANGRPGGDTNEKRRAQQQAVPKTPLAEVHSLYPSGPRPCDAAVRQDSLQARSCRQHGYHTTIVFTSFRAAIWGRPALIYIPNKS